MKLSRLEELKDGMWCRLASGEVWTFIKPMCREDYASDEEDHDDFVKLSKTKSYTQALLDMGAEWFPPIPEGYRLATEDDRKGDPPDNRLYVVPREKDGERFDLAWRPLECDGDVWFPECEYIVPKAKPQDVKQEPKVYTVFEQPYTTETFIRVTDDFLAGARVTVQEVER